MSSKGGMKGRKIGRNKKWCEVYKAGGVRRLNKMIKMDSHLRRHPDDKQAKEVRKDL